MSFPLVIIGAGGFGRETLDVVRAQTANESSPSHHLLGVVDSSPSLENLKLLAALDVPYLGGEREWLREGRRTNYLVGIGNPAIRRTVSSRFDEAGHNAAIAVHPTAALGSMTTLAPGVVICAGVQISTNVTVGSHVHVNANATVGHDATLHDFVSINPGATISGNVECESQVLIGAGAVVLQGLKVGRDSTVGAAACVTRSVPADRVAVGVPARWTL